MSTSFKTYIFAMPLAMVCIVCSHSLADEPLRIEHSYLATHVRNHQFICKSINAGFVLRSDWTADSGSQNLKFESAKFNGRAIEVAPEFSDIFDQLFDTEAIFGDCLEQSNSIGIAMIASTIMKEVPSVRLYFSLTDSGVKFRELVCELNENTNNIPENFSRYCGLKKW